ncbi:MAG: hypothetical protein QQN41_08685 [Nitrosopumilus sp.]
MKCKHKNLTIDQWVMNGDKIDCDLRCKCCGEIVEKNVMYKDDNQFDINKQALQNIK